MGVLASDAKAFSAASLPHITQKDLQDSSCWQLNHLLNDLIWRQIVTLSGGAGPINLRNTVVAPSMQIPSQTQPPSDNSTVLTLGAAMQLFSPQNFRPALVNGAFQSSSTSVQNAQPLPGSSVGLTGTITFGGGFTYNGNPFTNMVFTNGSLTSVS